MQHLRTHRLVLACIAVALLKLLLCAGMPIDVHAGAAYDDAWAVRAADFIAQGQWLGPYDDIALIKNVGFPLWLAFCKLSGLGYLPSTALLYIAACTAFVLAVRPLFGRRWLLFALFALLVFEPVSFSTDAYQRIYRNSITAAQALFVFAGYLGLYVRLKGVGAAPVTLRRLLPWALLGALALPWLWLSREDGIWILPFVVVATLVMALRVARVCNGRVRGGERRVAVRGVLALVVLVVPLVTTGGATLAVKHMNQQSYGVAVTAEINTGNFSRMVKALYAIDPAQVPSARFGFASEGGGESREAAGGMPHNQRVAVTHAALLRAYGASPTLHAVETFVEDEFHTFGDAIDNDPGDGEVNGGEFFWVLRRAARDAGVYSSDSAARARLVEVLAASPVAGGADVRVLRDMRPAPFADAFYGAIADELEAAVANGSLPGRSTMPSSIMTPWRSEYASQLAPAACSIFAQAFGHGDVTAMPSAAQGSDDGIGYFEYVTGNAAYRVGDPVPFACSAGEAVVALYRVLGAVLGFAGLVGAAVLLVHFALAKLRGKDIGDLGALVLCVFAVFLGASVLVAGLSYSRISSFVPIAYYYYGSAAYPLLLAFAILALSGIIGLFTGSAKGVRR